jgi:hypothetical protein
MKFIGTMLAVCLGMLIARNVSPVLDIYSRRISIRVLNRISQWEADRRVARQEWQR